MARKLIDRLTGKQSAEDVIAGLEKTKSDLGARIPALEAAKATALDERREALISGVEAGHAANRARQAEDDLAGITDALAEVERRLSDAIAKRDAEEAQAKREAVAKGLEDDAAKIVAAAKSIEAAMAQVVRAHAQMQLAVTGRSAPQLMDHRHHLSPTEFADGVLVEALVAALPALNLRADLFPGGYTMERREGRVATEAGVAAAERLRKVAEDVRNEGSADLPEWSARGPRVYVATPPDVAVFPTRPFTFTDRSGQLRRVTPLDCYLPQPVAEAAIRAKLADRMVGVTHQRAKQEWEAQLERKSFDELFADSDATNLGVNLQADAEAEEQRQHDAWGAAQAAERAELERKAA